MRLSYVLGFAIIQNTSFVLLAKNGTIPEHKGLLNGPGGKIEDDDLTIEHAMAREFLEETGVSTEATQWVPVHSHEGDYDLYVLGTILTPEQTKQFYLAKVDTDEPVCIVELAELTKYDCVPGVLRYAAQTVDVLLHGASPSQSK